MSLRWEYETYRRLYINTSSSWKALSLSARGLGDELLRAAEDDGSLKVGTTLEAAAATLCRVLGAHPGERRRVAGDLVALLEDGFVVHENDRIRIVNYTEAQRRKSPDATRKERERAKRAESQDPPRDMSGPLSRTPRDALSHTRARLPDLPSCLPDQSSPTPPVETPPAKDDDDPEEPIRTKSQEAFVATLRASEDLQRDRPAPDWWRAARDLEAFGFGKSSPARVSACLDHALAELAVARTSDPRTRGGWTFVRGRVEALLPSGMLEAAKTKFAQKPAKTSGKGEFDQQVYLDERKQRQQRAAGGSS